MTPATFVSRPAFLLYGLALGLLLPFLWPRSTPSLGAAIAFSRADVDAGLSEAIPVDRRTLNAEVAALRADGGMPELPIAARAAKVVGVLQAHVETGPEVVPGAGGFVGPPRPDGSAFQSKKEEPGHPDSLSRTAETDATQRNHCLNGAQVKVAESATYSPLPYVWTDLHHRFRLAIPDVRAPDPTFTRTQSYDVTVLDLELDGLQQRQLTVWELDPVDGSRIERVAVPESRFHYTPAAPPKQWHVSAIAAVNLGALGQPVALFSGPLAFGLEAQHRVAGSLWVGGVVLSSGQAGVSVGLDL